MSLTSNTNGIIIFSLTFLLWGCMKADPDSIHSFGMKQAFLKHPINMNTTASVEQLQFRCPSSSSLYQVRIFFPHLSGEAELRRDGRGEPPALLSEILSSLVGFEVKIQEKNSTKVLYEYSIIDGGLKSNKPFNKADPLSLWIMSSMKLKRGKEYIISLHIPPGKGDVNDMLLVLGIASDYCL